MLKFFGSVLLGVFVGAAAAEFLRRKKPQLVENIGQKVKEGVSSVKASFQEGYREGATEKAK